MGPNGFVMKDTRESWLILVPPAWKWVKYLPNSASFLFIPRDRRVALWLVFLTFQWIANMLNTKIKALQQIL